MKKIGRFFGKKYQPSSSRRKSITCKKTFNLTSVSTLVKTLFPAIKKIDFNNTVSN
jgi:hypothetical protein